jgi:hypothetical protein
MGRREPRTQQNKEGSGRMSPRENKKIEGRRTWFSLRIRMAFMRLCRLPGKGEGREET